MSRIGPTALIITLIPVLLSACGDGTVEPQEVGPVATISLSPQSRDLKVGHLVRLHASAEDADGNHLPDASFSWSSSDIAVAEVDDAGRVRALSEGTATITARSNGVEATAEIMVPAPLEWAQVTGGLRHACALTVDGEAYCWGDSWNGQGGTDRYEDWLDIPTRVATTQRFVRITGKGLGTCGLTESGEVHCWGSDPVLFGNGRGATRPRLIGSPFSEIQSNRLHHFGLDPEGQPHYWGDEVAFGTGNTPATTTPAPLDDQLRFDFLAAGADSGCGLTQAGEAYCWGANRFAELGTGSASGPETCSWEGSSWSCSSRPVRAADELTLRFIAISGQPGSQGRSGSAHACGIGTDGETYCWGAVGTDAFSGQTGTASPSASPVPVPGGHRFTHLALGARFSCGLDAGGMAYCWGRNDVGQLGGGTADGEVHAEPEPVAGDIRFQYLGRTMGPFMCGVTDDQGLYCWGRGGSQALAMGTNPAGSWGPVRVMEP